LLIEGHIETANQFVEQLRPALLHKKEVAKGKGKLFS
jgi:hypothetical protein